MKSRTLSSCQQPLSWRLAESRRPRRLPRPWTVTSRPRRLPPGPIGPERLSACAFLRPPAPAALLLQAEPSPRAKHGTRNRRRSPITSIFWAPRSTARGLWWEARASSLSRHCSTTPPKDEILDGLKKLGLDANKVKYVILSHAHGDHDGGAKLLQDTFPGVHLVYGAEDWDAIDKAATHMGGKPKRDVTGDDGMTISVGDASLRIVTMPGHTPGTLSYLFEIRDNGKPLRVAYVGGTAIPFNADAQYYDRYLASSKKMAKAAADYGATALITNHTEFDNAFYKAHTAADRRNGEANPFDVGADAVARYFAVVQDCTAADKLRATGK